MIAHISVLFPLKNRLSALLIKVKACGEATDQLTRARRPGIVSFVAYHILQTCQVQQFPPHIFSPIGLDKPEVRAKGINHPKYSVKPEYACLMRESANGVYL